MDAAQQYDVVVVGAGPAGLAAAMFAARRSFASEGGFRPLRGTPATARSSFARSAAARVASLRDSSLWGRRERRLPPAPSFAPRDL